MNRAAIFQKVREKVAEVAGKNADAITMETRFEQDLGLDSLDLVELVLHLEESVGIEVPDEDAEKLTSVGMVVDYIEKRLAVREKA